MYICEGTLKLPIYVIPSNGNYLFYRCTHLNHAEISESSDRRLLLRRVI